MRYSERGRLCPATIGRRDGDRGRSGDRAGGHREGCTRGSRRNGHAVGRDARRRVAAGQGDESTATRSWPIQRYRASGRIAASNASWVYGEGEQSETVGREAYVDPEVV